MAEITVKIHMDSKLKKEFEEFCNDMGMDINTAFNIYARKVVREYRIPFEIGYEIPNEETRKAIEDARNGIGLSGPYSSFEELLKDLNKDDD